MVSCEDEDVDSDFLHLGSGWKVSPEKSEETIRRKLFSVGMDPDKLSTMSNPSTPLLSYEFKAPKSVGYFVHRQGLNRATPYSRENKNAVRGYERWSIERCRDHERSDHCNQADFENLSLGHGCPCYKDDDLHI